MSSRLDGCINGFDRGMDRLLLMRWDLILLLALLALSWPVFVEKGVIVQCDYPSWASVVNMFGAEVLPQCRWCWAVPFRRLNAGEILGQPYSLSMIIPWLLMRVMSLEWALKSTVVAAYLTLGFGLYLFAAPKSNRFAACLAGCLCVLENLSHIDQGMWYNSFSIGLAFLFLASLERFGQNHRVRHWLAAVVLLALAIYTHPLGTLMAASGWLGLSARQFIAGRQAGTTTFLAVLGTPLLAAGLAFPQIVGMVVGSPLSGASRIACHCNPFGLQWRGLIIAILAGGLYGLYRAALRRDRALWVIVPPLLTGYVVYWNLPAAVPFDFPLKQGLVGFAERFRLVASAMVLVLFAVGLAGMMTEFRPVAGTRERRIASLMSGYIWIIIVATVLFGLKQMLVHQPVMLISERALADREDFVALCRWLDDNVEHEAERVYVEDTYRRRRDFPLYPANRLTRSALRVVRAQPAFETHYMSLVSLYTRCHQVNGFPVYQNRFSERYCGNGRRLFHTELKDLTARTVRERLWALNCRHVVAFSDSMREFLTSLGFLQCACRFGRFCVFTWSEMPPHYAWSDGPPRQVIPLTRVSNVLYKIDLGETDAARINVSLQYHANWRAYHDGREVSVRPWEALMRIEPPSGARGTLLLRYQIDRKRPLAAVAAGALLTVLAGLALRRQGTRVSNEKPSAGLHLPLPPRARGPRT
jgi:hypothetical protein